MTKVAIVTRTKERPLFLKRAVESVGNQTYTDYVHVIVNDGGDMSQVDELVKSLPETQQTKTKVFHRKDPSNAPDTIFNESIDRVDSEYFAIHDDDDTWHPEFLQQTVKVLENNDKSAGVVVHSDKVIEKLENGTIRKVKSEHYMSDMRAISLYRQCLDNQLTPIATLFRRSAYEKVGKFDNSLPVVGDWEFGIRLLEKYEVEYLDPGFALAYYHHRTDQDNSFQAHNHRRYITKVLNKYLREDLGKNKLGIGYIMNSLRYEQDSKIDLAKKLLPNVITKLLQKRVR